MSKNKKDKANNRLDDFSKTRFLVVCDMKFESMESPADDFRSTEEIMTREIYLEGLDFPVLLTKEIFTNEDGSPPKILREFRQNYRKNRRRRCSRSRLHLGRPARTILVCHQ